jgi:hypothetical protein
MAPPSGVVHDPTSEPITGPLASYSFVVSATTLPLMIAHSCSSVKALAAIERW